jgi:hypothetical protein
MNKEKRNRASSRFSQSEVGRVVRVAQKHGAREVVVDPEAQTIRILLGEGGDAAKAAKAAKTAKAVEAEPADNAEDIVELLR